jgi:hypothetical protein
MQASLVTGVLEGDWPPIGRAGGSALRGSVTLLRMNRPEGFDCSGCGIVPLFAEWTSLSLRLGSRPHTTVRAQVSRRQIQNAL